MKNQEPRRRVESKSNKKVGSMNQVVQNAKSAYEEYLENYKYKQQMKATIEQKMTQGDFEGALKLIKQEENNR